MANGQKHVAVSIPAGGIDGTIRKNGLVIHSEIPDWVAKVTGTGEDIAEHGSRGTVRAERVIREEQGRVSKLTSDDCVSPNGHRELLLGRGVYVVQAHLPVVSA